MTPVPGIALSGLVAATTALTASASNLANAGDTAKVGAKPAYNPRAVHDTSAPGGGVVATVVTLKPGQMLAFDPTSAMANAQGLVQAPEIDPVSEISNQIAAGHAFAFSLEALKAADDEQKTLLDLKT